MSGVVKSPAEIEIMDHANGIVQRILDELSERIRPGITTAEIDQYAETRITEEKGVPAFKGYPHPSGGPAFPGTVCASVNSEIVHGIPSLHVVLSEGDTISIDIGVRYKGYFGDGARTFAVGEISDTHATLLRVTREAMEQGAAQARVGNRVSDISHAVQRHVETHGLSVVREFVGHGIGSRLHEEPQVPNFGAQGRGEPLVSGMVLAIEPMVNVGSPDVVLSADDGWTARTRDGKRSAHFEVCVAVTDDGPRVLGRTGQRHAAAQESV